MTVLEILEHSQKPLSVRDIQRQLAQQNLKPNKTTLYRMLEKLTKEKQIEAVLLDSKTTFYELKTHHHHHFRCEDCEQIHCITDPELESKIHHLETQLASQGFAVEHHHFSLSGRCATCS